MNFQAKVLNCTQVEPINKRKVLELIAEAATENQADLDLGSITQALLQRERLGSTYVGNGIAIPHAKIEHLQHPQLVLLHLKRPIICDEFNEQADLFFGLLIPEISLEQHLPLLDELIDYLKDPHNRHKIHGCKSNDEFLQLLEKLPSCNSVSS